MTNENEQYADSLYKEDLDLIRVRETLAASGMPDISVADGYGRLLTMLVTMSGAKQLLEVGALGGYSGICLLRGAGEGGRLTSLELKAEYAEVARGNVEAAGYGQAVTFKIGDGKASLEQLKAEGQQFDFSLLMRIRKVIPRIWNMRSL